MNELERRLKSSLTEVRDAARRDDRTDRMRAKQELFKRMRRRRLTIYAGSAAVAGAAGVAVFLLFSTMDNGSLRGTEIAPADVPAPATAAVRVGDEPQDLSVGAHGYVWSTDVGSRTLSRIDPESNSRVSEIGLPSVPGDVAIGNGPVWVAFPEEGTVARVSPAAESVTDDRIEISDGPVEHMEIAQAAGALWVVSPGQLLRVDQETREQIVVRIATDPIDVAVKGDVARLLDSRGVIYQLDSETGRETGRRIQVPASATGDISFKAGAIWYTTGTDGILYRIDPRSGVVLNRLEVEGQIVDFVADPDVAWALSRTADSSLLTQVDREDGTIIGEPIKVLGEPAEVIISAGSLWMALSSEDLVLRFPKE